MGSSSNTAAAGSINYTNQAKPLSKVWLSHGTDSLCVSDLIYSYFSHTTVTQCSFGLHTVIAPLSHHTGQGITEYIFNNSYPK
jgi:hypothetical protein